MERRRGECVMDYYDRLVLGDKEFDERERRREDDLRRDREEREQVARKTWGMGINE